jgi:hypothetical protein
LKSSIKSNRPVICVIQNQEGYFGLPNGSHWFVIFAYNDDGLYVSNFSNNFIGWDDFKKQWDSPIPYAASFYFKGITNTSVIKTPKPRGYIV